MPGSVITPIIDCRNLADYCQGHIKGATSLPVAELFSRMHEMPQRQVLLQLCGNNTDLSAARSWLNDRGFIIEKEILWSESLKKILYAENRLEIGATSRRLWQPCPLIIEFIENIGPLHSLSTKTGLDIACGSGRDMIYLAMHNWNMTGIDYSYDALHRSKNLAMHNGVNIDTIQLDLENADNPLHKIKSLSLNSFDLICVFRYLHRPLLPQLQHLLKPSGFIIYQTFMEGCEKISSPRNPRFLLKVDELASIFASFNIIKNDVINLTDGRPVSAFIAQKPLRQN